MAVLETLTVKLTGDARDYTDSLDQAKNKTSAFSSLAQGALMGVGFGALNMAAQAGQALIGFGQDGIGMASDLGETMSKVGVVFQENAAAVEAWSANAATALGQSQAEAAGAAATFGNLFVSMGMGSDVSADMSMDLVELASDLASFNNIDPGIALEKLRAGLLGQSEPLQSLGVNLTAATIAAKAAEMGLTTFVPNINDMTEAFVKQESASANLTAVIAKYGEGSLQAQEAHLKLAKATTALDTANRGEEQALTASAKAQATYALILEQTTTAQGDFARTSEGLANQQRIADAQWKELQTTLGTLLLPVMNAVTRVLNKLLSNVLPPLSAFINNVLTPTFKGIADAVGPAIEFVMGMFTQLGDTMQGQADGPLAYLSDWFAENMPRIQQIVDNVTSALTGFWRDHGQQIMSVVQPLLDWLVNFWTVQMKTILDVVTFVLQLLTGDFEGAGQTLQGILTRWYEFFRETITNIVNGIRQWFQEVDWGQVGQNVVQGIRNGIVALGGMIGDAARSLIENFKNAWLQVDWGGIGRSIIDGIANGIRGGAGRIADAAKDAANRAFNAARSFLGIRSPSQLAAEEIGEPFAEGIAVGISDALGSLSARLATSLDGMMGGLSTGMVPAGAGAATGAGGGASITQNFYGAADSATVRSASLSGVKAGLRAAGSR